MFREFVVVMCAGVFVSGIAVQQNAPAQSPGRTSGGQQQDYLALPSQNAYQNTAAPSSKYLAKQAPSYQVNPAIVQTISETTTAKSVPVQSYGYPNVQQQTVRVSASVAADPSSPEYNNILERYVPVDRPIQPYYSAALPAKTVSVASHEAANGQIQAIHGNNVPFVVYTSNGDQSGSYYAVPVGQKVVEAQRLVNVQPSPSPGIQYSGPAVAYAANSTPRPFYPPSAAILESHGQFAVQSPAKTAYQVGQVQDVSSTQPQYITAPKIAYNVNPEVKTAPVPLPVDAKKVTLEAYNAVQTHPPLPPKYVPAPIPVPVIYQQVGAYPLPAQQFAIVTNAVAPTAEAYVQAPVGAQVIPVPVYANAARLQYQPIPVTSGHQHGYAKAALFSPASEVSRVIFNGLGVSYGW